MRSASLAALLALVLAAAAQVGCGVAERGAGEQVRVLVTRDHGERQLEALLTTGGGSMRSLLERSVEAQVAAGGERVTAVGRRDAAAGEAWSVYVNGVALEDEPLADVDVHGGDRVWLDLHARGSGASAVVGAFPDPFAHGANGKRFPVVLECTDAAETACDEVSDRLVDAGAVPARQTLGTGVGERTIRVLVGRWSELRDDQALAQIDRDPVASGVFARFSADGAGLALLDASGAETATLAAGAGLVAATRFELQAPTWAVSGTDDAGVEAAARALDERRLQRAYALAVDGTRAFALPTRRP